MTIGLGQTSALSKPSKLLYTDQIYILLFHLIPTLAFPSFFFLHSSRNHPISFLFSFFSRKHFFSSLTQAIPILSIVRFSSSTCKPPSLHHPYSCHLLAGESSSRRLYNFLHKSITRNHDLERKNAALKAKRERSAALELKKKKFEVKMMKLDLSDMNASIIFSSKFLKNRDPISEVHLHLYRHLIKVYNWL
ncbi:uncharacterized protein LOC122292211 [Carya illinoinensis]|uniref:uncharacterized protein LOC122292211 n=1 Tax=Carya illinoinensis TaxID=32201 RepID=UPI001C72845B|nr:uncharacterized protein LOC122292211 [Carya illinoinensis]